LGEHQLDKLGVTGSSPVPPIKKALVTGLFLCRTVNVELLVLPRCYQLAERKPMVRTGRQVLGWIGASKREMPSRDGVSAAKFVRA
jgi:predicted acyltransferase